MSAGNSHRMRLSRHPKQIKREYLSRLRLYLFGLDSEVGIEPDEYVSASVEVQSKTDPERLPFVRSTGDSLAACSFASSFNRLDHDLVKKGPLVVALVLVVWRCDAQRG